jgi:hypothetical protein
LLSKPITFHVIGSTVRTAAADTENWAGRVIPANRTMSRHRRRADARYFFVINASPINLSVNQKYTKVVRR